MSENPVVHSTFVIGRDYPASPSRVFAAFADPVTKQRWFTDEREKGGTEVLEFAMDFRVGGREFARYRFGGGPEGAPKKGTELRNDTVYQDLVPDRRIVFAYTMTVANTRISASLATVELHSTGDGTHLVFTEQAAFFEGADGSRMREDGWRGLLEMLHDALRGAEHS
jgi:uncharacterized protein YndB with AHSA1/START domain